MIVQVATLVAGYNRVYYTGDERPDNQGLVMWSSSGFHSCPFLCVLVLAECPLPCVDLAI